MNKELRDLISLLSRTFQDDPSSPSLLISHLPPDGERRDRAEWYVSISRYMQRGGQARRILFRQSNEDLDVCLRMAGRWMAENCVREGMTAERE